MKFDVQVVDSTYDENTGFSTTTIKTDLGNFVRRRFITS